jgi:hypothetical protein
LGKFARVQISGTVHQEQMLGEGDSASQKKKKKENFQERCDLFPFESAVECSLPDIFQPSDVHWYHP